MWSDQACEMARYGGVFSSSNVFKVESENLSNRMVGAITIHEGIETKHVRLSIGDGHQAQMHMETERVVNERKQGINEVDKTAHFMTRA